MRCVREDTYECVRDVLSVASKRFQVIGTPFVDGRLVRLLSLSHQYQCQMRIQRSNQFQCFRILCNIIVREHLILQHIPESHCQYAARLFDRIDARFVRALQYFVNEPHVQVPVLGTLGQYAGNQQSRMALNRRYQQRVNVERNVLV